MPGATRNFQLCVRRFHDQMGETFRRGWSLTIGAGSRNARSGFMPREFATVMILKSRPVPALLFAAITAILQFSTVYVCGGARVVINEVNYHPANDDDRLQYVEVHNAGDAEADLSGWKLRGVKFDFPNKARIGAGEFLVIARDTQALQRVHGTGFAMIGNLPGRIKRSAVFSGF